MLSNRVWKVFAFDMVCLIDQKLRGVSTPRDIQIYPSIYASTVPRYTKVCQPTNITHVPVIVIYAAHSSTDR